VRGGLCLARAEEEIDGLSDWEVVKIVERRKRLRNELVASMRSYTRALKGMTAAVSQFTETFNEAIAPELGAQLATETELFLAIEHSEGNP
jgi:hypothetical protein